MNNKDSCPIAKSLTKKEILAKIPQSKSKQILITGATSSIGRAIAKILAKTGKKVKALVRNDSADKLLFELSAEIITADINDPETIEWALDNVDEVIHIAKCHISRSSNKEELLQTNYLTTKKLVDQSIKNSVKKFIFISDSGFPITAKGEIATEQSKTFKNHFYYETLNFAEKYIEKMGLDYDFNYLIIAPTFFYGPDCCRSLTLFDKVINSKLIIAGSGDTYFQPLFIDDLAQAILLALQNDKLKNQKYIIAGKEKISINQFVNGISIEAGKQSSGFNIPPIFPLILAYMFEPLFTLFSKRPPITFADIDFFIKDRLFETKKTYQELSFYPEVDFKLGVKKCLEQSSLKGKLSGS
ncbi:MAG: NAD-dependent epimerase/dehydratase family protein [Nitrospinota bacterium]